MSESPPPPFRLLCDTCGAQGVPGDHPFVTHADLLAFDPVPRRARTGGLTPQVQRAFVAALAVTGSPRQAAAAVGRAAHSFEQLRKVRGSASFLGACERAIALAEAKASSRLTTAVAALARADAPDQPAPPRAPAPPVTAEARERLRAETLHRALHGTEEPIFYAGRQVGTRRVFNDRLAIHHLKDNPEAAGAPRGGGTVLHGREERIHRMLLANPFLTRSFCDKYLKHGASIVREFPRPWIFGREDDLIEHLGFFHQAMRKTFAQDPARAAADETLFGPEGAPEDFLDALRHASMIFQCFFPGVDKVLGDFREMVLDVAEKRRAGLLPSQNAAEDDGGDNQEEEDQP